MKGRKTRIVAMAAGLALGGMACDGSLTGPDGGNYFGREPLSADQFESRRDTLDPQSRRGRDADGETIVPGPVH